MTMPSPVLILGDRGLSQENINSAKKRYSDYKWVTFSAKENSPDEIRASAGQGDFFSKKKIILINDIPNQKAVREFLLDLVKLSSDKLKFIIWDSEDTIKVDPKTKTFNKTWNEFIKEFKSNKDHKIVNNGNEFSEKENQDCVSFIQSRFKKLNKEISSNNALLMAEIVGRNRSALDSEIKKLATIAPDRIDEDFVLEHAYPLSKNAVLYKFGNVLDSCAYGESVIMMRRFLDMGINENVLAEIIARKARWQLAAASYWSQGLSWSEIPQAIMQMGKFPSEIWHKNALTPSQKRKESEGFKDIENRIEYMRKIQGIKDWQIDSSKKAARAETIPMGFMAELTVRTLQQTIVRPYLKKYSEQELKDRLLLRCLRVYVMVINRLKEIRYGENPEQDLQEMVTLITRKEL